MNLLMIQPIMQLGAARRRTEHPAAQPLSPARMAGLTFTLVSSRVLAKTCPCG